MQFLPYINELSGEYCHCLIEHTVRSFELLNQREARSAGQASFYRPELDILRFFAFLGVYLSHSLRHDPAQLMKSHITEKAALLLAAIASSGRFGVQLFFLLSG